MLNWYLLAYNTSRQEGSTIHSKNGALILSATSEAEAVGKALIQIKKELPIEEGWRDHDVKTTLIPVETIKEMFSTLEIF